MAVTREPKTLQQAILYFSDYANCRKAVENLRWKDGTIACPNCGSVRVTYLEKARVYKCYESHAKAKFSLKVGTLFEDSPIGLEKWLPALWLVVNCKNGISSYELARALGVTQKTAWFMLSRLRMALQDRTHGGKLGGEVEVDETYIGGRARNMHAAKKARVIRNGSRTAGKVAVMGLLERNSTTRKSRVRTKVVPDGRRMHLRPVILENVEAGTNVYTDAFPTHKGLDAHFVHNVIDHAEAYVDGNVHTNGLENFWSLLKRTLKGTYVSVEPFHLFRYLDEQAFRFNEREGTDQSRFYSALKGIIGRRVTYTALTGSEVPERC